MNLNFSNSFSCIVLLFAQSGFTQECGESNKSNDIETIISSSGSTFREISPKFFGFNLELIEFQNSLWDNSKQQVFPTVVQYLQRFPGAVYRYPGGTVANNFDWISAVGPIASRTPQQVVDYQSAKIVEFGPTEYLNFVAKVNGTAWYVLNLNGSILAPMPPHTLATSATNLVRFMHNEQEKGLPSIYRWELGNELDRGRYRWSASKYVDVSKEIMTSVKPYLYGSNMVNMVQDWSHTGASTLGIDYNAYTAKELNQFTTEFSSHLYYDGAPWGPPVPRLVKQLCKNLSSIRSSAQNGSIWVTEHARAPLGTPSDPNWKNNWPQTGDMAAAISSTDMMISLARTKNINGAFIHSLHGSAGPWPLVHRQRNGTIYPSTVYWALLLLRESMLEDVLTSTISVNSNGAEGTGYNTNAVMLANKMRSKYSIWTTNRSDKMQRFQIHLPNLLEKKITLKIATLASKFSTDNNYTEPYKTFPIRKEISVNTDAANGFSFDVPSHSISAISFTIQ
jgi:alpha-N-arabinofuranosidase